MDKVSNEFLNSILGFGCVDYYHREMIGNLVLPFIVKVYSGLILYREIGY